MEDLSKQIWRSFDHRERDLIMIIGKCARLDRETRRSQDPHRAWSRQMSLNVEVEAYDFWQGTDARSELERILALATGDRWSLNFFEKAPEDVQQYLPFSHPLSAAFSVSDGLDSFIGAALWSANSPQLMAAAINASTRKVVQVEQIYRQLPNIKLLPFRLRIEAGESKEDTYRTRALTFFVPAMLAAARMGIKTLSVLESGQGSLGSYLLTLGREYPYVSLTPFFLRELSKFVQGRMGADIAIAHPHLWQTKAQVVRSALASRCITGRSIGMTSSCGRNGRRRSREGGSNRPCGICAGCLHRRCALVNAGHLEEEKSKIYVYANLHASKIDSMRRQDCQPFKCDPTYVESAVADMRLLAQVQVEKNGADVRYLVRRVAKSLQLPVEEVQDRLKVLLDQHRQEWNNFLAWSGRTSWISQHGGLS